MPQATPKSFIADDDEVKLPSSFIPDEEDEEIKEPSKLEAFLKSAWDAINKPIVDIRRNNPRTFEATEAFAKEHPVIGGIGNFLADVTSGASSALNLATAGTLGTSAALATKAPKAARLLGLTGKGLSAPLAAEGAYDLYNDPSAAGKTVGALELAGGILGMRTKIPSKGNTTKATSVVDELSDIKKSNSSTVEAKPGKTVDAEYEEAKNFLKELNRQKTIAKAQKIKNNLAAKEAAKVDTSVITPEAVPEVMPDIPVAAETPITNTLSSGAPHPSTLVPPEMRAAGEANIAAMRQSVLDQAEAIRHPLAFKNPFTKTDEVKTPTKTPEISLETTKQPPRLAGLENVGDGTLYIEFDKTNPVSVDDIKLMFPDKNINITEFHANTEPGNIQRFRIDALDDKGISSPEIGDAIETEIGGQFKDYDPTVPGMVDLEGGLGALRIGGLGGGSSRMPPRPGPTGAAIDKLMDSLQASKGLRTKQEAIYKRELAEKFAASAGAKGEGADWARKAVGAMKGDLTKINRSALELSDDQTTLLYNAIRDANINQPEKIRAAVAMGKILDGGLVPQRNEIQLLNDIYGGNFGSQIVELHGGLGAVGIKLAKTMNTMKAMSSTADMSAFRQGIGLAHRAEFRSAAREYTKFMGNREYYNGAMKAIEERPSYLLSRDSGLHYSKAGDLLGGEEIFSSNYIHDIPLGAKGAYIRDITEASERGYTGFLNKLRADTYDNMIQQATGLGHKMYDIAVDPKTGVKTITATKEAKAIARYINNATGRGSLGSLEKFSTELSTVLWSPRLLTSRLTMLTNPKLYLDMPKGMRFEAIKSLLSVAAIGVGVTTLAGMGGAKVSHDVTSSDFMKARFGNKTLDPLFGFQQPIVTAARMLKEAERFRSGRKREFGERSIPEIAGKFMANKESPAVSLAHELLFADRSEGGGNYVDQYGNKKSLTAKNPFDNEIAKRFIPLFAQDLEELATAKPKWSESVGLNSILAVSSGLGMGVQDYPERSQGGSRRLRVN